MKAITKGALKKLVQEEISRQRQVKEEGNVAASTPGYLTPRFLKTSNNERKR